ncbi:MAG: hypothetical protein IKZ90_08480 [Clostridiales bacterium]|jgi:hypothetical protein|nr:hypothetical protein [Clostridiales bacterium]
MVEIVKTFALCFVLTVILEELTALILGVRTKMDFFMIFVVNMLTNPAVVFLSMVFYSYTPIPWVHYIGVLELIAFFVEAKIYKDLLDFKRFSPYRVSFYLNLVSFTIGTSIVYLLQ